MKPKTVEEYLRLPYERVVIYDDESGTYTAMIREFSGCITEDKTAAKAMVRLDDLARDWIEAALDLEQQVPEPAATVGPAYSGRIALRLPKSLHQKAAQQARVEGASLNTILLTAIAEYIGGATVCGHLMKLHEAGAIRQAATTAQQAISLTETVIDMLREREGEPPLMRADTRSPVGRARFVN